MTNPREVYKKLIGTIKPNHIIHHIDGNRENNKPENLSQMSYDEHHELHAIAGRQGGLHSEEPQLRKEMTLRLPYILYNVIMDFKKLSGVSATNFIYNAILWYCVSKNLVSLSEFNNVYRKKNRTKIIIESNPIPEGD